MTRDDAGRTPAEATFFWGGGPIEVAPRTWFQCAFSACTGFETDAGLVLSIYRPRAARAVARREAAPAPAGAGAHPIYRTATSKRLTGSTRSCARQPATR